eukprot:236138_1
MSNHYYSSDDESHCPICLDDSGNILCELDCYSSRIDNVKHCVCYECATKLFESSRWYQQAKCPFCRHVIHRDILNAREQHYSDPQFEIESYNHHSVMFNAPHINRIYLSDRERLEATYVVLIAAVFICGYLDLFWITVCLVCAIIALVIRNTNVDLSTPLASFLNYVEQFDAWIQRHHEAIERRPRTRAHSSSVQRIHNRRKRKLKRKESLSSLLNEENIYQTRSKNNRDYKVRRRYHKYNKRFKNRDFR